MENHNNEMVIYAEPTKITIISYLFVLCLGLFLGFGFAVYCQSNKHPIKKESAEQPVGDVWFTPLDKARAIPTVKPTNKAKRKTVKYSILTRCKNCNKTVCVSMSKGTAKNRYYFICPICGIKGNP